MSATTQTFSAAYRAAFAAHVSAPDESGLHAGYELGRDAVELGLSVVELARMHHGALAYALRRAPPDQHDRIAHAAADFFAESVSAFEVVRRGYEEARERALVERRRGAIVRRLSSLLADASLAVDSARSLTETLQLVAEAARELTRARCCVVAVENARHGGPLTVVSGDRDDEADSLSAPLTALSGTGIGWLEVLDKEGGRFTQSDRDVVGQLAEMAAAAIERTRLYD